VELLSLQAAGFPRGCDRFLQLLGITLNRASRFRQISETNLFLRPKMTLILSPVRGSFTQSSSSGRCSQNRQPDYDDRKDLRGNEIGSDGPQLVFPGDVDSMKPMSNNTLLVASYRMGYRSRMTAHGFCGVASTILHEQGGLLACGDGQLIFLVAVVFGVATTCWVFCSE
jgi:hypothetical protein